MTVSLFQYDCRRFPEKTHLFSSMISTHVLFILIPLHVSSHYLPCLSLFFPFPLAVPPLHIASSLRLAKASGGALWPPQQVRPKRRTQCVYKTNRPHSTPGSNECVSLFVCLFVYLLWPPYVIGQAIIFLPCGFFLSIFLLFFLSSPNLSRRRLDVYHASTHSVALVRI